MEELWSKNSQDIPKEELNSLGFPLLDNKIYFRAALGPGIDQLTNEIKSLHLNPCIYENLIYLRSLGREGG